MLQNPQQHTGPVHLAQDMAPTCQPQQWGFDVSFCSDSGEDRGGPERRREGGERREEGGTRSQVARGWKEAAGEAGLRAVWSRQIHLALCCLSLLPLPSLLLFLLLPPFSPLLVSRQSPPAPPTVPTLAVLLHSLSP